MAEAGLVAAIPGRYLSTSTPVKLFTRHYTSSGASLHRIELSTEAIRLTRQLHERRPEDREIAGLLALMLLTDARRLARTRPDGALIPLAEQDRASGTPQPSPKECSS